MKTIFLVRHGETVDCARRFYGRADVELSRMGEQQSRKVVNELVRRGVQLVVTTGLRRTDYCGEIAEKNGLAYIINPNLCEVDFGSWEGMTWDEIKETNPDEAEAWLRHPETMRFPNGEDMGSFRIRIQRAWRQTVIRPERRIAVVTHSGVLSYLLQYIGKYTEDTYLQYGEVIELHFDTHEVQ